MFAGDGDANGQVNNADKNDVWKPQSGSSGYKSGDFSMNGQVDNVDKNDYWKVNSGKSAQLPGNWSCGKSIADSRDGQAYPTVQVGTQCWMGKNMNIGVMINNGVNQTQQTPEIIEKYCYGNSAGNCSVYGGLYQWNEMMQYVTTQGVQGICPPTGGWHVATDEEWTVLSGFLGGATVAGGKLKEAGTSHWAPPNTGATNESGFTALPGGYELAMGGFGQLTYSAELWTSTQWAGNSSWYRELGYNFAPLGSGTNDKNNAFSVRCMKSVNLPPFVPFNPNPPDGALNQSINTTLYWLCNDPENDPLTYDVCFGAVSPPPQVATGLLPTLYNPGTLSYATTYYWKIIAHDDHGNTTPGPVWTFSTLTEPLWQCGNQVTDPRDGQMYSTILIGTQCWMAENLNIGVLLAGNIDQSNNAVIEKYCYENNSANCDVYGGLYQWNETMQYVTTPGSKGICMDGWHLPTDAEYCTLTQLIDPTVNCYVSGPSGTDAGTKMKSVSGWVGSGNGTNASGFSGLPAGFRNFGGGFFSLTEGAMFWASSGEGFSAWDRILYYNSFQVYRYNDNIYFGYSVRCLAD